MLPAAIPETAYLFMLVPRLPLRLLYPLITIKELVLCPLNWSVLLGELCIIMYGVTKIKFASKPHARFDEGRAGQDRHGKAIEAPSN